MSQSPLLLDYLKTRRSVTLPFLKDPGPSAAELEEILTIATRVPDHGKLAPWRLITISGDAREKAGAALIEIFRKKNPDASDELVEAQKAKMFMPAPLTVAVISTAKPHPKIPAMEQLQSASSVAFNLLHAAAAFGYGAQWVTRWFAYDDEAASYFGLDAHEQFVGFIHIGTPEVRLEDRERPALEDVVTDWKG